MKEGLEGEEPGDCEATAIVEANYKDLIYGDGEKKQTELYEGS